VGGGGGCCVICIIHSQFRNKGIAQAEALLFGPPLLWTSDSVKTSITLDYIQSSFVDNHSMGKPSGLGFRHMDLLMYEGTLS